MTTDQIIKKLMPLEGDEFRQAIGPLLESIYKCEHYRRFFSGCLAELAFSLRDKAHQDSAAQFESAMLLTACCFMGWDENKRPYASIHRWAWLNAKPKHWIVAAISTLEGE